MSKKFTNKVAVGTYVGVFWGIAFFAISFAYEGWVVKGFAPLLTPLGIAGLVLVAICIGLFIWNICRDELGHEQWLNAKNRRLPDLAKLRKALRVYMRTTFKISRKKELLDLSKYGLGDNPDGLYFWSSYL